MHHRPNYHRLGQILIHLDVIGHKEVIEASRLQMNYPEKSIGKIMIELDYITKEELNRALSLQKDIDL